MEGIILKGLGSFYTISTDCGEVVCKLRGKLRLLKTPPLPGDRAIVSLLPDGTGWILELLPRKNMLVRPPVCNIDCLVLVVSQAPPVTDFYLIDRMTVSARAVDIEPLICVNKQDISSGDGLLRLYSDAGFAVFPICALTGEGVDGLEKAIAKKSVAFAGNSGVGKSTLLNALDPRLGRATGELSEKLGRGKHTTRHVELFTLSCGALVADTPGFSAFELASDMEKSELARLFIDFEPYIGLCRFSDCRHVGVQGCAVEAAVGNGIRPERYESYKRMLAEMK